MWGGYDQTPLISKDKFYYPIDVSLGVTHNVWLKSLRKLQLRKKLNLTQSIHLSLDSFTHTSGKIVAKMKALEQIAGSDIIT